MYEEAKFKITGIAPLIMHNGRTRDPLDFYAKELKKLTGKRKKSDEDHLAIARLEWEAGFYWNEQLGPYIPSRPLRKLLIEGARKSKDGKIVEAHVTASGPAQVLYKGPRDDLDKLWAAGANGDGSFGTFVDRRVMTVQRSAIVRTRPIFPEWSAQLRYSYDRDECQEEQVRTWLEAAGHHVGLLDSRPEFGKFTVE